MNKLSFIDKLKILLDVSKSSNLYIVVLILLVFIGITLLTTNKKMHLETELYIQS